MSKDDGHGPKQGCKAKHCPVDPNTCPFLIAERKTISSTAGDHHHEYVLACSCGDIKHIRPPKVQHGTITYPDRGAKWLD